MAAYFDYKNKGYTIQFQTRGLTISEADLLWNNTNITELLSLTEETGHNLVVYKNGLCLNIVKNGKSIIVRCGRNE